MHSNILPKPGATVQPKKKGGREKKKKSKKIQWRLQPNLREGDPQ